jgi:error-prone DNA polymerase
MGLRETYDLEIDGDHNFLANDLVVHNSHAASFSLLVYTSAWLKKYHPAAFTAGLLNAQPMGFYQPAQLVRDAREHGVRVRPACVQASGWDMRLELDDDPSGPALRLGLRLVKGLGERSGRAIEEARWDGAFTSIDDLARRARLGRDALARLADANALAAIGLERREAVFEALARTGPEPPLFRAASPPPEDAALPVLTPIESVAKDYATVGLTLERHPVALVRAALDQQGAVPTSALFEVEDGRAVVTAGLVICRQRPQTASGIVFFTIEDETGVANLIVRPNVFERFRKVARSARLLVAHGKVERDGQVIHVLVRKLEDASGLFAREGTDLAVRSRDFH